MLPSEGANTIDLPVGRLHATTVACTLVAGTLGAPDRPLTSRPPTSARSPSGPHSNGPGSGRPNRHVARVPVASKAHADPEATNVTSSDGPGALGTHAGRDSPDARVTPAGGELWVARGGVSDSTGAPDVEDDAGGGAVEDEHDQVSAMAQNAAAAEILRMGRPLALSPEPLELGPGK